MSTVDLDAIRRRVPTSYAGPWYVTRADDGSWLVGYATDNPLAGLVATVPDYGERLAEFIAHAREDVPDLLAEVERLRGIVGNDDPRHIIEFRDRSWTIKHPNSCDPDLFGCVVNRAAERDLVEAPEVLGRYYCDIRDGRFVVTDIAARPTEEDGTRDG